MVIQKNVLKIFNTIFEINHFLIIKYIDLCNNFASNLQASNRKLTQAFEKENFADLLKKEDDNDDDKAQNKAAHKFKNPFQIREAKGTQDYLQDASKGVIKYMPHNNKGSQEPRLNKELDIAIRNNQIKGNNELLNNENLDTKNEELELNADEPDNLLKFELSNQNQTISKEIKKTYTEISNSKRQSYFIRLSILIGYFGLYLGLHCYALPLVFTQISLFIKTTSILNNKQSFLLQLMVFLREEILLNQSMVYNKYDLVSNSIDDALESQKQVLLLSQNLTDNTLNNFLNSIDLDACPYIIQSSIIGNTEATCESFYNEILTHGLGNAITLLISAYRNSHFRWKKIGYSTICSNRE